MEPSALCVGQASVELVGAVPRYPVNPGGSHELSAFTFQGGGAAATAAVTLARLGARVCFAGTRSDDFLGEFAAAGLEEAGVSLAHLKLRAGGVAPVSFVALEQEHGRRTVFFTRGNLGGLSAGEVPLEALDGVGLLLVDGAYPEAQLELSRAARERGVKVLLAAHEMTDGMEPLAMSCDAIIASEGFARELSPTIPGALTAMLARGASCAVVTLGEDGCVGQEKGAEPLRVEAVQVQVVDPTGAGDVFRGAFGFRWLQGASLKDRLRYASAAASLKCESYGAREGIPDGERVLAALAG
ncbi:MAG: carbohydrate kinase family protein [Myxococcaceae bacterium]